MLAWLRSPISFFILTVALAGWLYTWSITWIVHTFDLNPKGMPLYCLVQQADWKAGIVQQPDKPSMRLLVIRRNNTLEVLNDPGFGANVSPANTVAGSYVYAAPNQPAGFGLMTPILTRRSYIYGSYEFWPDLPALDNDTAIGAALATGRLPKNPNWSVRWNFLAHDASLVITIAMWLASLLSIPRWPLWRRLTPAQRRRARNACPNCNYSLEGLSSTACPECNTPSP